MARVLVHERQFVVGGDPVPLDPLDGGGPVDLAAHADHVLVERLGVVVGVLVLLQPVADPLVPHDHRSRLPQGRLVLGLDAPLAFVALQLLVLEEPEVPQVIVQELVVLHLGLLFDFGTLGVDVRVHREGPAEGDDGLRVPHGVRLRLDSFCLAFDLGDLLSRLFWAELWKVLSLFENRGFFFFDFFFLVLFFFFGRDKLLRLFFDLRDFKTFLGFLLLLLLLVLLPFFKIDLDFDLDFE